VKYIYKMILDPLVYQNDHVIACLHDIKLGEGVEALGGLAVIIHEHMENSRVDRQLRGRSGRQGDPGSSMLRHLHQV
jgi:hypothetical protein